MQCIVSQPLPFLVLQNAYLVAKIQNIFWIRANYYIKKDYFISIQAYYRSRSSCLSLLSFQITSGSCTVCNGTLTIESEATFS